MNILIGFTTALVLIAFSSFFVKKEETIVNKTHIFFLIYVLFCSYIYKPSLDIIGWVGLSLLLYCVVDDLKTKTVDIRLPILVTLIFFINTLNPYYLLISFLLFCLFLLFSLITKENIVGQGDAYLFLPLVYLLGQDNVLSFLYLSIVLGGVFVSFGFIFSKEKTKEYAFAPYLVLAALIIYTDFYPLFITLCASGISVLLFPFVYFTTRKNTD